ncbi:MAG: hypothetical protein JO227_12715 [Acetobacteraceae bacterium]|nr:hypothetical protein [Acetobacteraceae bacterium]
MITRRGVLAAAAVTLAPTVAANRLLTLLVGAAAGAAPDAGARAFAPFLSRHMPFTDVSVRNVPGEGGLTAFQALAAAVPSGATLGWLASPTLPARIIDHDVSDLLPRLTLIGAVEKEPIAFVSPAATPLESVQDIIRRSGEDADAIPLGTPPAGSPAHLAALRLQALAGTRLNLITFPSAAAARQAVVAGNVAAAALGLANAIGDLRDGRLFGLGVAAHARSGAFPEMPALNEAGLQLSAVIIRGLAAPAGTPGEVISGIATALQATAADAEFQDEGNARGFRAVWIDGQAWAAQVEAERQTLAALWATEPWLSSSGQ